MLYNVNLKCIFSTIPFFQETGILPMVEMKKSSLSYDPDT